MLMTDQEFMDKLKFLPVQIGPPPERKEFQKQISKCALNSLVVQTLQDVISSNDEVFSCIPAKHLFKLMDCFQKSYNFSAVFNSCIGLRNTLHKSGYMAQVPNLLKIETMSAQFYLALLMKLYTNKHPFQHEYHSETEKRLIPLIYEILEHFNGIETTGNGTTAAQTKKRNETAWRPVIGMILELVSQFDEVQFKKHGPEIYPEIVNLLLQDVTPETRVALHSFLIRVGKEFFVSASKTVKRRLTELTNGSELPNSLGIKEIK
jgi:brefeldin A-inhibited guanine nucleotide-exchange protein